MYSKFVYGSQFSGEKQFKIPILGCRDIKQKPSLILFGTPCTLTLTLALILTLALAHVLTLALTLTLALAFTPTLSISQTLTFALSFQLAPALALTLGTRRCPRSQKIFFTFCNNSG